MEEEESNDALDLSRQDSAEDIYAQLDRLDESLNNELEDLKRMVLSQESTSGAQQISEEGVMNESDDSDQDLLTLDSDVEENNDCLDADEIVVPPKVPQSQSADIIDAQPPLQSQAADQEVVNNHTDTTGKSNGIRRQRNSQRERTRNDTKGNRGNQQKLTNSEKKNIINHRNKQQNSRTKKQVDVANEKKNDSAASTSAVKKAQPASAQKKNTNHKKQHPQSKNQAGVASAEEKNNDANSSSTAKKTQSTRMEPKRMEGRGRGSRRRQALQRHQER